MIEASVNEIVAGLRQRDTLTWSRILALRLPLTVVCRLLGVPDENVTDFHEWATQVGAFAGQVDPTWNASAQSVIDQANEGWLSLEALFGRLVAQKRQVPADDILSELVRAFDAGAISERRADRAVRVHPRRRSYHDP